MQDRAEVRLQALQFRLYITSNRLRILEDALSNHVKVSTHYSLQTLLLTTCSLLLAACCLLLVTCYLLLATCYVLLTTCYVPPLLTTYHLPPLLTTYHLPLTTYHLPLTTYYLPLTTYYLLRTNYYLLLTTYYLLLSTHSSPLTNHHSLLIAYCLLHIAPYATLRSCHPLTILLCYSTDHTFLLREGGRSAGGRRALGQAPSGIHSRGRPWGGSVSPVTLVTCWVWPFAVALWKARFRPRNCELSGW